MSTAWRMSVSKRRTDSSAPWSVVLALALPLFVVSSRLVAEPLRHPWSHVWVVAAVGLALEVRRLLHRWRPSASGWNWHLYFLAMSLATIAGSTPWELLRSGAVDMAMSAALIVVALAVGLSELRHLRASGVRG